MSYKIEIMDEYSFGQWFSNTLRLATESEATQYCHNFSAEARQMILPPWNYAAGMPSWSICRGRAPEPS